LHRGSICLIFNSKNEIFVHQRSFGKDYAPGTYDMFVGGVVAEDDTYDETMKRELEEEVGIQTEIEHLFNLKVEIPEDRTFYAVYKIISDGPFTLQKEEIIHGKFMLLEELIKFMETGNIKEDALIVFNHYLKEFHGK